MRIKEIKTQTEVLNQLLVISQSENDVLKRIAGNKGFAFPQKGNDGSENILLHVVKVNLSF